MSDTFICDECDERITSGYTVAWSKGLGDCAAHIHFRDDNTVNLCPDCWPRDESLVGKVKRFLGVA